MFTAGELLALAFWEQRRNAVRSFTGPNVTLLTSDRPAALRRLCNWSYGAVSVYPEARRLVQPPPLTSPLLRAERAEGNSFPLIDGRIIWLLIRSLQTPILVSKLHSTFMWRSADPFTHWWLVAYDGNFPIQFWWFCCWCWTSACKPHVIQLHNMHKEMQLSWARCESCTIIILFPNRYKIWC